MALSEVAVRNAKAGTKPGKLTDSAGLYLHVALSGRKTWRYDYRWAGTRQTLVIGAYPDVSLKDARRRHLSARQALADGTSPAEQKRSMRAQARSAAAHTIRAVGGEWLDEFAAHRSPGWRKLMGGLLENHIFPALGDRALAGVTPQEVLVLTRAIADRGTRRAAESTRWLLSRIFRYGIRTLRCTHDPAADVRGAIPLPPTRHHAPIPASQIPQFLERLAVIRGRAETRIALELLLLTFVRKSELSGARWAEISFVDREWRIPAERMKMRREHVVPLSQQALGWLSKLHDLTGKLELCFPHFGDPFRPMSNETFNAAFRQMGYGRQYSPHSVRATASTILNEEGFEPHVIERQLAHMDRNKIRAAYNHASYMKERRAMMQFWADYIDKFRVSGDPENVLQPE